MSASQNLETTRLTLRPFREDDFDRFVELFANPGFIRFSGSDGYTREQTRAVMDKILGWQRDGLPSQFAVIERASGTLIGSCGFSYQEVDGMKEIEIGYDCIPTSGTAVWPRSSAAVPITLFAI